MEHWPDNPIISNSMRTGYPDGREPKKIYCPVCGEKNPESFYKSRYGEILGCDYCVHIVDSYFTD